MPGQPNAVTVRIPTPLLGDEPALNLPKGQKLGFTGCGVN